MWACTVSRDNSFVLTNFLERMVSCMKVLVLCALRSQEVEDERAARKL